jgi:hypothetical protein
MPFTAEQFFEIFEKYNQSLFPMQFILVWMASAAVLLTISKKRFSDEIITGILAILWLWAGIVYHLIFFTRINSGAYLFSVMFIAEGLFFFYLGIVEKRLSFHLKPDLYGVLGIIFVTYALIVYPVVGVTLGRFFPAAPTFGAPCPLVIFTFGILMWTDKKFSPFLLIIPFLWAIIGSTAALRFGVTEDFGLPVAAFAATCFILHHLVELKNEAFS